MFDFIRPSHDEVDKKISELERKLKSTNGLLYNWAGDRVWDEIFSLSKKIHEDFKQVRYPTKQERDIAWQRFFQLRNDAYRENRKQYEFRSELHFDPIMSLLKSAYYSRSADFFIGEVASFGLMKTTIDDMKSMGKTLGEAMRLFNSVKHEMTFVHKKRIQEQIDEVKKSHDTFWGRIKERNESSAKSKKERTERNFAKNNAARDKALAAREKVKNNIDKNNDNLEKTRDALRKFENKKSDLQSDIWSSTNDRWKDKAAGWLTGLEEKIRDIEAQIDRIEGWIEEDEGKIKGIDEHIERLDKWIKEDEEKLNRF